METKLLEGLMQDRLQEIEKVNKYYALYEGKQTWEVKQGLDYVPTQKITNYIKKLIDKKARFMFGKEPFFNYFALDAKDTEIVEEKEELFNSILKENKWHSKLLKAKKDCSIGGRVAIKLWADRELGVRILFAPAQEFIATYDVDDIDTLEQVIFFYSMNDEEKKKEQRIKRQKWEMKDGKCILNEGMYDGEGELLKAEFVDYDTGLDFIPVVIIQNGGLTGETQGYSDVQTLWSNQDAYNKLTSDDLDALKFQMFGQTIFTDAAEETLEGVLIAPGAMIDLKTDIMQVGEGKQAKVERLENRFSYGDKYEDTVNRVKSDMYDLLDIPDTSLEQLRGLMASGKSMRAVYWDLMAVCDEDWTEWGPALEQMADFIYRMIYVYDCYKDERGKALAEVPTTLKIERYYPIPEDEMDARRLDLEEVKQGVRSKISYIRKWSEVEDEETELERANQDKEGIHNLSWTGLIE